jgi:hypothetical protein
MIVCNDALRFVSFMVLSPDPRFTNVPRLNSLAHPRSCLWRAGKCRPVSTGSARSNRFEAGFIHTLKRRFEPKSTLVAQTFLAKVHNGLPICFRVRCCDLLRPRGVQAHSLGVFQAGVMASIPIELGRDYGPAHGGAGRSRLPIV